MKRFIVTLLTVVSVVGIFIGSIILVNKFGGYIVLSNRFANTTKYIEYGIFAFLALMLIVMFVLFKIKSNSNKKTKKSLKSNEKYILTKNDYLMSKNLEGAENLSLEMDDYLESAYSQYINVKPDEFMEDKPLGIQQFIIKKRVFDVNDVLSKIYITNQQTSLVTNNSFADQFILIENEKLFDTKEEKENEIIEEVIPYEVESDLTDQIAEVTPVVDTFIDKQYLFQIESEYKKGEKANKFTFTNKLGLQDEFNQNLYTTLRDKFNSYRNVTARVVQAGLIVRSKGIELARITLTRTLMRLYLALDPTDIDLSKYSYEYITDRANIADTPFALKIRTNTALQKALSLVDIAFEQNNIEKKVRHKQKDYFKLDAIDYSNANLYNSEERSKIRYRIGEIKADELLSDSYASKYRLISYSKLISNVDLYDINNIANPKDIIDLEFLKKNNLVAQHAEAFKINGVGSISKPLIYRANEYDLLAIKMILLSGGTIQHIE